MRWIIGDIHGMLKPLEKLVNEISRVDPKPAFYFVGDYVNRGAESSGVIDLLLGLSNAKFIRGNHDDVLDQILHGTAYAENASHGDRYMALQWFLEHGLYETLVSYGVTREMIARVIGRKPESLEAVIERFPEQHRKFIHGLEVFIEDEDLFLVHGKWPLKEKSSPAELLGKNVAPAAALRHEILWGRFTSSEIQSRQSWPKRGFFGHTPVATYKGHENDYSPIIYGKMALLDTAAALSPAGRLSAICPENSQLIQADPAGKLVEIRENIWPV